MEKEITLACDKYSEILVKGICDLYSNQKFSDLIVEYKNQKLFLHTFMLDIFAPQLLRRFDENNCNFEDEHVTVQILKYIFKFLYTGHVRVEEHELPSLQKSAEQLGVTLLEEAIVKSRVKSTEEKHHTFLNNNVDLMQCQDLRNNFEDETTRIIVVNMGTQDKTDVLCEENETQKELMVFGEEIVVDKDIQSNKEIFVESESDKEEEEPSLLKSLLKKSRASCYSCHLCDFKSDQKLILNRHQHNVHDTDRPLKCERCDYRGKTKKLLNIHMATHGTEMHPCTLCSKTFRTKFVLYKHVAMFHKENTKKNACHLCTFQSRYVAALDRHLVKVHRAPRENRAMGRPAAASSGSILGSTGFESFDVQCTYCEFKCKGRAVLDDHLAVKHGVDGDGNAVQDKYQCKHCEFTCVAKYQLRTHFSQKHAKKLKCEKCDFSCIGKDALDSHFKFRHLGVKAFMCETCGLQLASEGCLRRHLFIHKTGQKHTCNLCEKSFSQQWYLVKHVKLMHDDVEPKHKCPHCEFSSKLRGNLNQHIQRMHKNAAKVLAVRNQK